MQLRVVIESSEDQGFVAHVPALRGCWSQGRTHSEAIENIREAIEGWIEAEQDKADKHGQSQDIELVNV